MPRVSISMIENLHWLIWTNDWFSVFIKIFHFEPNTKRTTILCDLLYYAFNFARTNKFNHEQISTFLSIIKRVHQMCICMWFHWQSHRLLTRLILGTPFANMEETYQFFKVLVLKHSLSVSIRVWRREVFVDWFLLW